MVLITSKRKNVEILENVENMAYRNFVTLSIDRNGKNQISRLSFNYISKKS